MAAPTPYPESYSNKIPVTLPSERNKVRKRTSRNDYRRVNKPAYGDGYFGRLGKRYGAGTAPDNEGYPECDNVSNSVVTCYPDADTSIRSGDYSKLIWNPNLPQFTESGDLDIYLFSADTEQVVQSWKDVPNQRGSQPINPGDDWWSPIDDGWGPYDPENSSQWADTTRDWTYYAVLVPAGQSLSGGEEHQATFTAVQTAPLQNLVASSSSSSMSSASSQSSISSLSTASLASASATQSVVSSVSSVSSASMASLSSISQSNSELYSSMTRSSQSTRSVLSTAATMSAITTTDSNGDRVTSSVRSTPTGVLQDNGDDDRFPAWGIAVIVVLGVLALLGIAAAMYLLVRHLRRTHGAAAAAEAGGAAGGANTPTQSEPLMKENQPNDGLLAAGGGAAGGAAGAAVGAAALGARSASSERSSAENDNGDGPITSNEAAAMADAFRQALRSPEFDSGSNSNKLNNSDPNTTESSNQGLTGIQENSVARQPELVNASDGSH
ncbi:hypothetical protein E3Q08_02497 [Wallemia mellicola]|nr:hypothetical protein E3Q08_02497 [Wallemia mellicola]